MVAVAVIIVVVVGAVGAVVGAAVDVVTVFVVSVLEITDGLGLGFGDVGNKNVVNPSRVDVGIVVADVVVVD